MDNNDLGASMLMESGIIEIIGTNLTESKEDQTDHEKEERKTSNQTSSFLDNLDFDG